MQTEKSRSAQKKMKRLQTFANAPRPRVADFPERFQRLASCCFFRNQWAGSRNAGGGIYRFSAELGYFDNVAPLYTATKLRQNLAFLLRK